MRFRLPGSESEQNPVETAGRSLRQLSARGVTIPPEVAAPILQADKTGNLKNASADLERRFWSAYSTLNSRIKYAEDAKDRYRRYFFVILASLLVLQFYYSTSIALQVRLIEVGKALHTIETPNPPSSAAAEKKDLER